MNKVIKKIFLFAFMMLLFPSGVKADTGAKISIGGSNYNKETGIIEFYVDAENHLYCSIETDENCEDGSASGIIEYDKDVLEFIETDEKISKKSDGKLEFSINYSGGDNSGYTVTGNGTFKFKIKDQSKEYTTFYLKSNVELTDGCFYTGCVDGNDEYTVKLDTKKQDNAEQKDNNKLLTDNNNNDNKDKDSNDSKDNSINKYLMYGSFGLNALLLISLVITIVKSKKTN